MQPAHIRELFNLNRPIEDLRPQYQDTVITVLRTLWRRKVMIAGITALFVMGGLIAASLTERLYAGEALIQFKFEDAGTAAGAVNQNIVVDAAAVVESEAEIIRSVLVARRVADRFPFEDESVQDINADADTSGAVGAQPGHDRVTIARQLINAVRAFFGFVLTEPLPPADQKVLNLQRNLTVQNDAKSYLIRVIYHANDPDSAAQLANFFAEEYLGSRVQLSLDNARRTRDWFSAQVAKADLDYQVKKDEAQAYRDRTGVVAADSGNPQAMEQQLRDLVGQLSNARLEQLTLEEQLQRIRAAIARDRTPSLTDLLGSGSMATLIDNELNARQEFDRIASLVGTKHSAYERASAALTAARAQLSEAVMNSLQLVESDFASARAATAQLEARLVELKLASIKSQTEAKELGRLEASAESARGSLEQLRSSLRDAQALMELKPVSAQLISAASPIASPTSPRILLIVMLASVGGLAVSLMGIGLLELRDTGFRSCEQVTTALGLSHVGMLPRCDARSTNTDKMSYLQSLKAIAILAGLRKVAQQGASRMIVVTSAVPDEGVVLLAQGLAETLSAMGHKVLLIERTDKRERDKFAAQRDSTTEICTAPDPINQIAAAGQSGPGAPTASYRSLRFSAEDLAAIIDRHGVFKFWSDENGLQFDFVIVEAPPVLTDPDALVLVLPARTVVVATRWNTTPRKALSTTVTQLARLNITDPLIILTDVNIKKHRSFGVQDSLYFQKNYKFA